MSDRTSRRAFLAGAGAVGASLLAGPASAAAATVEVYVAGDSTASTYPRSSAPRTGWGQALPVFFTSGVSVVNHAKSGASSKSFESSATSSSKTSVPRSSLTPKRSPPPIATS